MTEKAAATNTIIGRVVSDKMDKSVTVLIERKIPHPLYKKYIKRSSKICAHDEANTCAEGDLVEIQQCRPLSKTKSWKLVRVVESAAQ
ncbi:MAG: 30S ribosomal protein S17 [Gammaproteobacteria bacterium]|nr:30S ribosomal protein S17 [Gammaproteobacteria bacterium]